MKCMFIKCTFTKYWQAHMTALLKHLSRYEMLPLPHSPTWEYLEKNILKFLPFLFVLEFFYKRNHTVPHVLFYVRLYSLSKMWDSFMLINVLIILLVSSIQPNEYIRVGLSILLLKVARPVADIKL